MASPVPLDLHLIDRQNRPCQNRFPLIFQKRGKFTMPVFIVWTRQEAAKNTTTHLLNPTSNMSIPMTELEVIKRAIRECHMTHVEQLRDLDIVEDSLGITPSSAGYKYSVHIVSQAIWHENAISKQGSTRHHVKSSVEACSQFGGGSCLIKTAFQELQFSHCYSSHLT